MKNSKPQKPKAQKSLSLPKLQAKLMHSLQPHNYSRLNFPRKDDSNYVRDVGRKHFLPDNSSNGLQRNSESLRKLINPEMPDYGALAYREFRDGKLVDRDIAGKKGRIREILEGKLNLGNYHASTEISQAPYARDYQTQKNKNKPMDRQKETDKDRRKLKTELNTLQPNFNLNYNSVNLNSNKASIQQQSTINYNSVAYQDAFTRKMASVPTQLVFVNKDDHRKFNPTYISSNFI